MDVRTAAVLAHVLAAFWFAAGYVATNACTELARRTSSDDERRSALLVSGHLDHWLNVPGGTAVGITGLVTVWVFGYSFTTPWILLSVTLMAIVIGLGILYWGRFGRRVGSAIEAGDWTGVRRLLTDPRIVLISRLENLAVLAIVVLMIVRPG